MGCRRLTRGRRADGSSIYRRALLAGVPAGCGDCPAQNPLAGGATPDESLQQSECLSYSSPVYHEAVKDALAGPLAAADALVLDIRGGWGGASPSYMDIFNPTAPR